MRTLRVVVWAAFLATLMWGQFNSGFQGTITDSSGAVVSGVTVQVTNIDTGVVREVNSSADGVYVVPSLGPGNYRIVASRTGFSSAREDSVVLPPDQIRKVDFTMQIGNVQQTIDVSGQASILQTEEAHVSSQMTQATLNALPVPNNSVFNLMVLQPGASGRTMNVDNINGRSTPNVNFAGARSDSNSFSLDGMSVNSISRGGNAEISPSVESIEQVSVQLSDANASEGRNMGAHVDLISKSGTNQFHGSAWDYFGNDHLAARNFFSPTVAPFHRNQFGYTVGGPIFKDRTFFFTSYEGIRQSGSAAATATVETKDFRDWVVQNRPGSLAAYLLSTFQPAAYATTNLRSLGSPLSGVQRCGGCAAANQFSTTPLRTASGDILYEIGTASWNQYTKATSNSYTIRVDHELRPGKDRLFGYYYHFNGVTQTPPVRDFERDNPTVGNFVNLNETHIFSPTMLNEFGAGLIRYIGTYTIPRNANVPPINITGLSSQTFQDTNPYPGGFFATELVIRDSVSIIRGSHSIRFGGERRRQDNNLKHTASYFPNYTFTNILTFANDTALSESRTVNPLTGQPTTTYASQRISEYGSYVQDNWKVRKDFTVNLGLRYEYFGPYTDAKNRLSNFVLGPGATWAQQIATGSSQIVGESWNANHLNFAPRLGVAWDIGGTGKNVIRAGYGVGYDRLATVYPAGYRNNPPLIGVITAGTQFGNTFTYALGTPGVVADQYNPSGLGYPVDASFAAGLNSQNGINGQRLSIVAVSQNLPQPYTQNWFFVYQRALPGKMVAEADYMGSKGTHLVDIANVNQFAGDLSSNRGVFRGFNPSFSSINMATTNGNSSYHGLTLMLRKPMTHGLNFQAVYTYSKAIDISESEQGLTTFQDVNNKRLDRSLASFNVPQRLSFTAVYSEPFLRSCPSWYCKALGSWDLSAYGVFEQGQPIDVYSSGVYPNGDWNGDGTAHDRPNAPLTSIQATGFSEQQFLNGIFTTAQFPTPALGTNGTLGRNAFQGPSFERLDLALSKVFPIRERFNLRFRFQAFNALNHTNLGAPATNLTSPSFGKSTTAEIPRQMTLSLMLRF